MEALMVDRRLDHAQHPNGIPVDEGLDIFLLR